MPSTCCAATCGADAGRCATTRWCATASAQLAAEIEVGRQLMMHCAELATSGTTPPEMGAISKVFSGELMERFGEAALDMLGHARRAVAGRARRLAQWPLRAEPAPFADVGDQHRHQRDPAQPDRAARARAAALKRWTDSCRSAEESVAIREACGIVSCIRHRRIPTARAQSGCRCFWKFWSPSLWRNLRGLMNQTLAQLSRRIGEARVAVSDGYLSGTSS